MDDRIVNIKRKVKRELDRERYQHTLGVAYTASCLAMRYGADIEDAYIAGLLHDCAKCIPNDDKLEICRKYGIGVTDCEGENPSLLHAKVGAFLAEKRYGVRDKDILSAIRSHTTGMPGMTLLQKIIFVADYIEPNRNEAPDLPQVREQAFIDIDKTVCIILYDTLRYLEKKGAKIDSMTQETYDYYSQPSGRLC